MATLLSERVRWWLSWLLAWYACGVAFYFAWHDLDDPNRPGGNWGHASIDFGGQWLMGRMCVEGHLDELYNRGWHLDILQRHYPDNERNPEKPTDTQQLMGWLVGSESRRQYHALASTALPLANQSPLGCAALVFASEQLWPREDFESVRYERRGGALYPPIHAFVMAPVSVLPPRTAYRVTQIIILVLTIALGGLVHLWTRGKIWWPLATTLVMVFPGYAGAINLGQNPVFSLALLLVGWFLLSRNCPFWAGCSWGLLAFKPVWAVTFFLVPILTRRWRMTMGMALVGASCILVTLPFTGLEPWLDWIAIGQTASTHYGKDYNWIVLSRDIQNIPRRYLLEFPEQGGSFSRNGEWPHRIGVGLWLGFASLWLGILAWRGRADAKFTGPVACFTLLGAYFACVHFMYYDALLAACPVFLLFAGYALEHPDRRWPYPIVPTLLMIPLITFPYFSYYFYREGRFEPVDTVILLMLWFWCGWAWYRQSTSRSETILTKA